LAVTETSESLKLRAAQRAIDKRAPFHRQRNGIDDAIIIEVYGDATNERRASTRFAFVSHNTKDFSHPGDNTKLPHSDIAPMFSKVRSLYFITLGEALRRVDPAAFADLMIEGDCVDDPRRLPEIVDAMDLLFDQVWYNRHRIMRDKVHRRRLRVVAKESFPIDDHRRRPIRRDVLKQAMKAAARVEQRRGLETSDRAG
jgi:hypothetical protein